jgi:hypothetical protein
MTTTDGISISLCVSLARATVTPPPAVRLFRIPHDCERDANHKFVYGKRDGSSSFRTFKTDPIPQPYRAWPDQTIPVKRYPALLNLLWELNPEYTYEKAMAHLNDALCWCNGVWGIFSAAIITAGAVLEAERVEGNRVYFKSILVSGPTPTAEYVLNNHLSALATSVHQDGRPGFMTRANGYGTRSKVRMFIVREKPEPLWIPKDELHELPAGFNPPDELWKPV